MRLVRALPSHAKDLKKIHIAAYQKSYRGYLSDEYLDSLSLTDVVIKKTAAYIEKTEGYLVETEDGFVGFMYISSDPDFEDAFEIMALYVHPDCHKKGVGSFMVNEICALKRKEGFSKCIAWTMKHGPSIGFYEKKGFRRVEGKEKIWREMVPLILFEKDI